MKFTKKSHTIMCEVKKAKKETAKNIITAVLVAVLTFTFVLCYDIDANDVTENDAYTEVMCPPNMEITTPKATTTTTTKTTTKAVTTTTKAMTTTTTTTAVTTSMTTTSNVTTTTEKEIEVPATEPVVVEKQPEQTTAAPETHKEYISPETEKVIVIEVPVPEPEPIIEEEYYPETSKQIYYTDDENNGYSWYISYDDDKNRYHEALNYVSEMERIWLCNVTANEYGSDYVPVAEKAKIVAVVMNRKNNGYWGSSIQSVLEYRGQFSGYWTQYSFYQKVTPSCIDAVDYYFAHSDEWQYQNIMYISGDGRWNYFS